MKSLKYDFFGANRSNALVIFNNSASELEVGKVLMLQGYDATNNIQTATPIDNIKKKSPIGVVFRTIPPFSMGEIIRIGIYSGLNTSLSVVNDPVYFDNMGNLTLTKGSSVIGSVVDVGITGKIFVNIGGGSGSSTFLQNEEDVIMLNDDVILISDLFLENLSAEYKVRMQESTNAASIILKAGIGGGINGYMFGEITNVFDTPNKLNIDFFNETIRIQNKLGSTIAINVLRVV